MPAKDDWRYHQVRDWSCSNESKPWQDYPNQPSPCFEDAPANPYWTRDESVEDVTVTYPPAEISAQPLCSLPGQNGWCRGEAGLQLTGYEPVAGEHITGLEGTLNGETFAVQNSASAVIPALEGQSDFQYWAHSSFADTSLMGASSLLLDSQPPLVTASSLVGTLGDNSWYISDVGISLSFTDPTPGSGLDGITYLLGGGAPQPFTSPLTLGDGQHEVLIRAADLAGNLTELSQIVQIDTIPPHLEDSLEGTLFNGWYAKTALLSASASDAGSGLAGLDLSLDGGAWTTYDSPLTIGDGQHQAVFRARDLAGNITLTALLSFRVDAKGPKIDLPGRWNIWDTAAFVVRDGGSGLGSVEVIISDPQGRWPKVTRTYTPNGSRYEGEIGWNRQFTDGTLAPIGKYRVTVKASDIAGNFSQKEATLVIPAGDSPGEETIIQPLVEADDPPFETTFALPPDEPKPVLEPVESVFGGTSLAALNEERRSETPTASLPGSENILWGAGALAAMAAMTAYYEQKRREEEEAQRAAVHAQFAAEQAEKERQQKSQAKVMAKLEKQWAEERFKEQAYQQWKAEQEQAKAVDALSAAASGKKVLASPASNISMPLGLPPEAQYAFLHGGAAAQEWIDKHGGDLIEEYQTRLTNVPTVINPILTPFPTPTQIAVDGNIIALQGIYRWNMEHIVPKILEFEAEQGLKKGHLTIAALTGEVDRWAKNKDIKDMMIDVYGNRIHYLSSLVGDYSYEGKMSLLHFFSDSHQTKFDSRFKESFLLENNAKFKDNDERIFWIEESRWTAAEEMYNAIFNQPEKYASFDPINNIADINKPFNHGIVFDLSKVANLDMFNNPTIGTGANQFLYYEDVVYEGKDTINTILSYCQEQYFYNGIQIEGCTIVE
ncbi:MAG: hypothetical protein L6461_24290 [Anaerolineae bacterium]|nr:hypothetical protein [Anaerolineae bacterium]